MFINVYIDVCTKGEIESMQRKRKEKGERQRGILCSKSFATSLAEQQRRSTSRTALCVIRSFFDSHLRERERGEKDLKDKKKKKEPL